MFGPPRRCPACPGTQFHRSRRTKYRFVLKMLCVQPFRCENCGRRRWRLNPFGAAPHTEGEPQPARGK
jgi:hypothetical protein